MQRDGKGYHSDGELYDEGTPPALVVSTEENRDKLGITDQLRILTANATRVPPYNDQTDYCKELTELVYKYRRSNEDWSVFK